MGGGGRGKCSREPEGRDGGRGDSHLRQCGEVVVVVGDGEEAGRVELEEGGGKRERREGQGRRGVYVGGG